MRRAVFVAAPLLAVPWFVGVVLGRPEAPIAMGAPPHLAEGDLLAGAMYPWAEADDAVVLDVPRETLSIRNDGEATTTHLDAIALAVFDEPVARTPSGAFVAVSDARDAIDQTTTEANDRRVVTVRLPASGTSDVVVIEAKSTRFAETTFFRYVAKMGQGLDTIMERAVRTDCPREHTVTCAAEVMEDEQRRLGLPLLAEARDGTTVLGRFVVYPPGATRPRAIALPLPARTTELRLETTPGFWELGRITHGRHHGERVPTATLTPIAAHVTARDGASRDVTALVTTPDGARVAIAPDERLALTFAKPPPEARTTLVVARGYYRVPIGGRSLVDPFAVLAHRAGFTSLPRFAARSRH